MVRGSTQLLDLTDEVGLLVVKLLVFGPVRVEPCEELHKLVLVAQQNVQNRLRFVGVSNKHLHKGTNVIYNKRGLDRNAFEGVLLKILSKRDLCAVMRVSQNENFKC
jgi:hypothetical protein